MRAFVKLKLLFDKRASSAKDIEDIKPSRLFYMFQDVPVSHSLDFNGSVITLQSGLLAQQATSTVLATMGDTSVLAAVVIGKETQNDYFPLQVIYEERMYASGKIKGSRFIKREGRPSENAVLIGRMVDRSLRSLFDKNTRSEVQVIITVLSVDEVNPPDTLAVIAASAALKIASDDFQGPVSSIRVGQIIPSPVNHLANQILQKINPNVTFEEIGDLLTDLCKVVELSDENQKTIFKSVFDKLVEVDSQLATKLKEIYQNETRDSRQEILNKYTTKISVVAPNYEQMTDSKLDLVVSGDGHNIMMVEAGALIVDESELGNGLDIASQNLSILTKFQTEFIEKTKKDLNISSKSLIVKSAEPKYFNYWESFRSVLESSLYAPGTKDEKDKILSSYKKLHFDTISLLQELAVPLGNIHQEELKQKLNDLVIINTEVNQGIAKSLLELVGSLKDLQTLKIHLEIALDKIIHQIVQDNILNNDKRLDGRALTETRKIVCQINPLPRTHGSSLFMRGETQVLNVLTLGTSRDAQLLDDMEDFEEQTKRYIHHYNFPAYSVGEVGRYIGPGRREIGHGALAEKALLPVLPSEAEFPYTMRLVSECLGSNGSTSMASTCASTLSLMEGGVPIKDMVAGVAMGLVLNQEGKFKVLTDIQGSEDHYGDMDFKVTGTKDGITALQLDNKVSGLTVDILKQALLQAKAGRMHILEIMRQAISEPKKEISQFAPGVQVLNVPVEKIGEVIGPSGKIIKGIIAKFQVDVDIEDVTGKTFIYGKDRANVELAAATILKLIKDYQPGDVVNGKVFRIETYGAFIKIDDTDKEGMIHISQFSDKRVNNINDVVKMGQELRAKILEINEKGQLSLTVK